MVMTCLITLRVAMAVVPTSERRRSASRRHCRRQHCRSYQHSNPTLDTHRFTSFLLFPLSPKEPATLGLFVGLVKVAGCIIGSVCPIDAHITGQSSSPLPLVPILVRAQPKTKQIAMEY